MYILKLNNGDGILTYTFQDTSFGKTGDAAMGISVFLGAMKKYFSTQRIGATLQIMSERGLYYNRHLNKYVAVGSSKEDTDAITIPLNTLAETEMAEWLKV